MRTFCKTFDHWLYHPSDTGLICENRIRLSLPECLKCKGKKSSTRRIELPRTHDALKICLDVDKDEWVRQVRLAVEEYNIEAGRKKDEISARRIANLLGEVYMDLSSEPTQIKLLQVMIVEKDMFDLSMELRLKCDPLEPEERVEPYLRKKVLCTWGIDKASGLERYTTQLKEWTIEALQKKEETKHGREINLRDRAYEGFELEKVGIG
jgi:hypothetical protein